MSVTMPRAMLMACLLSPSLSWALGLGEIHLNSALNEPLNAEIDLIAAAPDELTALHASLASRDAFTRYGIDKPAFLSNLTFKVGKGKDGRDALLVNSIDAIPEPFVTFLVEVNWARGRLMREYTVLLDPPLYTPGEAARSAAPVVAATTSAAPARPAPVAAAAAAPGPIAAPRVAPSYSAGTDTVTVGRGDTLSKIARALHGDSQADVDQTMIALYRANPGAFGGNINVLRQGAVLRVPNADQIAALNQREAMGEVHRQMDAWRGGDASATPSGHLRLVPPTTADTASGNGTGNASAPAGGAGGSAARSNGAETQALRDRVKDLEGQLAESKRLVDIRSSELNALQRKLAPAPTAGSVPPVVAPAPAAPANPPPMAAAPVGTAPVGTAPVGTAPVGTAPPATNTPAGAAPPATPAASAAPPPPAASTAPAGTAPAGTAPVSTAPVPTPARAAATATNAPTDTVSWIDWVSAHWWAPLLVLLAVLAGLALAARKRRRDQGDGMSHLLDDTDVADARDPASQLGGLRGNESFVVEESGPHPLPHFSAAPGVVAEAAEFKEADDTMSSESAVNLDQGDPLAEADFHMAYGLYDQAADLVRIALEREPDRRDLRLKLLEIYFVWGNKEAFLQTAKGLEATRERAPAGEWDKILIMGKQICPDEPMFGSHAGSGRGAGAMVDLNLEGGENRVDIDLFGDPEGERSSLDQHLAKDSATAVSSEPASEHDSDLDFMLDTPERGADDSPTRQMPPRDEPTVESELMNFVDSPAEVPTTESPALRDADRHDRIASKLPSTADQTAEVSLDDLGLNLDDLEETGTASSTISVLEQTDHSEDSPTMLAGLDVHSRRLMEEAEQGSRAEMTDVERELEASFVADLEPLHDDLKTAVLGPESAPTVMMPREFDVSSTSRFKVPDAAGGESRGAEAGEKDPDSTSKLRAMHSDSIDMDLDRLASALGSGDTVQQPRAEEDLFSNDVFESTQRNKLIDLDVGDALSESDSPTNKIEAQTNKLKPVDLGLPEMEMEPVTMSEVGTKLDLARAYMDMGDPEGARSILEEVVQEGSASQKQEASRLIESLPG